MTTATLPAALYKRKSRDPNNTASIEDQARIGRADIAEQGWRLAAELDDAGISASRFATKGRPDWEQLLGMIEAGRVGAVVLWESNRGDRKLTQWSAFLDLCRERGVLIRVVTHERTYDMRRDRDWKTLAEDGVSNAHFSNQLSTVVKRGNEGAALRGDPPGPCPYGYRPVYSTETGKRLGWEKTEFAADIRFIVTWIGKHKPVMALENDLFRRGVKSPGGKDRWDQAYLRDIARNPIYAGLRRTSDGVLHEGKWPRIVTRQQWQDACAALDGRKPMARPGRQKHLLSHLATCAECGEPMVGKRREDRWYYRCKASCFSIRYEWLDTVVDGQIVAWLMRPDAKDSFRRDDTRSAAVADELATLTARRDSFRDQAADGGLEPAALTRIEARLNPQIAAKTRELETLTVPPALHQLLGAKDKVKAWLSMPVQAKRVVITALIDSIVVSRPPRRWRWMVLPDPADFGELVTFEWKRRQ
jgi:DNA invertase Pin-like site-specific DNA recombinase